MQQTTGAGIGVRLHKQSGQTGLQLGLDPIQRPPSRQFGLPIGKPFSPGMPQQGMTTAHHPGIDLTKRKRHQPLLKIRIKLHLFQVRALRPLQLVRRIQAVGVGDHIGHISIAGHRLHHPLAAGETATTDRNMAVTEAVGDMGTVFAEVLPRRPLHAVHQVFGRNGIQPATIDDFYPACPGGGIVGVHHTAQPVQFTTQIRHVGTMINARRHHLTGVSGPRRHCGGQHPGAFCHLIRRGAVRSRHNKQRQVGSPYLCLHPLQPGPVPPSNGPA